MFSSQPAGTGKRSAGKELSREKKRVRGGGSPIKADISPENEALLKMAKENLLLRNQVTAVHSRASTLEAQVTAAAKDSEILSPPEILSRGNAEYTQAKKKAAKLLQKLGRVDNEDENHSWTPPSAHWETTQASAASARHSNKSSRQQRQAAERQVRN